MRNVFVRNFIFRGFIEAALFGIMRENFYIPNDLCVGQFNFLGNFSPNWKIYYF